jgi:hypothetical protein
VDGFEVAALDRANESPFDINEGQTAADRSCFLY